MCFWGIFGNELNADSFQDLCEKLSNIDSSVPQRTQGRRTEHRERFGIKVYLKKLGEDGRWSYPFWIKKSIQQEEPPDFILTKDDGRTIGVEYVEAGAENFQRDRTASERRGALLESGGWAGDQAERDWASDVLRAVISKIEALNSGRYVQANEYELLVYDNTEASVVIDMDRALGIFRQLFDERRPACRFQKIWLIHNSEVHSVLNFSS